MARPDVPKWWLHYLFAGIIPFTAMIVSPFYLLYNRLKKIKTPLLLKSIIITSVIIALLHLRTESGLTLYAFIFKLPGINSMRVLTRFMHVEIFLLLLIPGYFLVRINSKYILIFFLLVFADNFFAPGYIPREEKAGLIKRKEILLTELEKHDYKNTKAVALVDTTQQAFVTHLDMMIAAQAAGINTVNGYSSYCPDDFGEFFKNASKEGLYQWMESRKVNKEEILVINREY